MRASVAVHANRLAALRLEAWRSTRVTLQRCWSGRNVTARRRSPASRAAARGPRSRERDLNELRTALVALDECARAGEGDPSVERESPPPRIVFDGGSGACPASVAGGAAALRSGRASQIETDATWVVFVESERHRYVDLRPRQRCRAGRLGRCRRARAHCVECATAACRSTCERWREASSVIPVPILRAAAELDQLLFADFDADWERVVVCPVGDGYDLPWGLLPTLRDRPFVLTPSITAHLRCQQIEPVEPRRVVAVSGPGLTLAEEEVRQVIDAHGGGEWLTAATPTPVASERSDRRGRDRPHRLPWPVRVREPDVLVAGAARRSDVRPRVRAAATVPTCDGALRLSRRQPHVADRARDPRAVRLAGRRWGAIGRRRHLRRSRLGRHGGDDARRSTSNSPPVSTSPRRLRARQSARSAARGSVRLPRRLLGVTPAALLGAPTLRGTGTRESSDHTVRRWG